MPNCIIRPVWRSFTDALGFAAAEAALFSAGASWHCKLNYQRTTSLGVSVIIRQGLGCLPADKHTVGYIIFQAVWRLVHLWRRASDLGLRTRNRSLILFLTWKWVIVEKKGSPGGNQMRMPQILLPWDVEFPSQTLKIICLVVWTVPAAKYRDKHVSRTAS